MICETPWDDISRALKSIDRAGKAVRSALRAGQMTKAAERAADAVAQPLSIKADAEIYKDTGKIVALDDDDLECAHEEEVIALTVDADVFVRVMDEAADRLDSRARSWNEKANEFKAPISQRSEWIAELQREYADLCKTAQEGERYLDIVPRDEAIAAQQQDIDDAYERLVFLKQERAQLREQQEEPRLHAARAQDDAARKRCSADEMRAAAQAQRRLAAMREVESEARRQADAAVAKARRRVMAATLADDRSSLFNDRKAELLERFADLVASNAAQRLSADPEI